MNLDKYFVNLLEDYESQNTKNNLSFVEKNSKIGRAAEIFYFFGYGLLLYKLGKIENKSLTIEEALKELNLNNNVKINYDKILEALLKTNSNKILIIDDLNKKINEQSEIIIKMGRTVTVEGIIKNLIQKITNVTEINAINSAEDFISYINNNCLYFFAESIKNKLRNYSIDKLNVGNVINIVVEDTSLKNRCVLINNEGKQLKDLTIDMIIKFHYKKVEENNKNPIYNSIEFHLSVKTKFAYSLFKYFKIDKKNKKLEIKKTPKQYEKDIYTKMVTNDANYYSDKLKEIIKNVEKREEKTIELINKIFKFATSEKFKEIYETTLKNDKEDIKIFLKEKIFVKYKEELKKVIKEYNGKEISVDKLDKKFDENLNNYFNKNEPQVALRVFLDYFYQIGNLILDIKDIQEEVINFFEKYKKQILSYCLFGITDTIEKINKKNNVEDSIEILLQFAENETQAKDNNKNQIVLLTINENFLTEIIKDLKPLLDAALSKNGHNYYNIFYRYNNENNLFQFEIFYNIKSKKTEIHGFFNLPFLVEILQKKNIINIQLLNY